MDSSVHMRMHLRTQWHDGSIDCAACADARKIEENKKETPKFIKHSKGEPVAINSQKILKFPPVEKERRHF